MKTRLSFTMLLAVATAGFAYDQASSPAPMSRLPVKEATVFKDGHAFVLREGRLPVNADGQVMMDDLPRPIIGTFWAYSKESNAKLASVVAGRKKMSIERTALTLRELVEANLGADAIVTETNNLSYPCTLIGFPTRSSKELMATSPPGADERLPQKGNLVLLKTAEGIKAIPFDQIRDITFKQPLHAKTAQEEFRDFLTLKLDWSGQPPDPTAELGLVYLQKGLRWIPGYKVDLDGQGHAHLRLQATVLNELTDLEDVTLQLVIGVPTFYFKDTLDPMAIQETAAQLSAFFQEGRDRQNRQSALASQFSNAFMAQTQAARMGDFRGGAIEGESGSGPEFPESARNEDLFVFTVRNVTLKQGERMVLPIAECTVPYEDVFVLDLPFAPPPEMARNLNNQQQADMARLFTAPKVMHKARLMNQSNYPFTTAPALILRQGQVIAQGMMTYTAIGASSDLTLTAAVDLQVNKTDNETGRTPNAFQLNGDQYMRVDLAGEVRVTNHRPRSVKLEVTRYVLGHVDTADHDGQVKMSNVFESRDFLPIGGYDSGPYWWNWFSWPWWWHHVNGVGSITWQLHLDPSQETGLGYTWHYYWR
ncbi:MAG: hypothetical protein M1608_12440 [Candidatus Omnitrophica bacterium]|nr:hypothetical protein [Candidatus Omnitrophota bacterium]